MTDDAASRGRGLDLKDSLIQSGWEPLDLVNTTDALLSVRDYYLIVFTESNSAAVWLMKEVQGALSLFAAAAEEQYRLQFDLSIHSICIQMSIMLSYCIEGILIMGLLNRIRYSGRQWCSCWFRYSPERRCQPQPSFAPHQP